MNEFLFSEESNHYRSCPITARNYGQVAKRAFPLAPLSGDLVVVHPLQSLDPYTGLWRHSGSYMGGKLVC